MDDFSFLIILAWITSVGISNIFDWESYVAVKKEPIEKNIVGNELINDKFYEINGKRAYLEVDGKSIEEYRRQK